MSNFSKIFVCQKVRRVLLQRFLQVIEIESCVRLKWSRFTDEPIIDEEMKLPALPHRRFAPKISPSD